MNVAVTGAAGHVGGNLVRALIARGDRVKALERNDARALEGLDLERVRGDLFEDGVLDRLLDGVEVVFHLAALISISGPQGGLVEKTNVEGPKRVAEACLKHRIRRMVHVSSIHAFRQHPLDEPIDESRERVSGPKELAYDRSKADGEAAVREAVKRGLDAVVVNPTGIVGPFDFKPSRMGEVLGLMAQGRMPGLVNAGFNWVDVRDVAAGAMAAMERGRTGEGYLLSGHWVPFPDLAREVEKCTGQKPPAMISPMWLARIGAPFGQAWAALTGRRPLFTSESLNALRGNRAISHEKASRELGYAPRPFEETIRDTLAWFRETGAFS